MKKYLLNILVWLLFWTHGAEETITVENADFRIDSNRKRIPAWNVQAARWKPVKTSDDIPGLMITLRKWGEGRFQTVATYNIANPEAGSYCYSLMIRLDSDNVETIQFYLPLTMKNGEKAKTRYVTLPKSQYPAAGEWQTIHAQFTVPDNCSKIGLGIEFRANSRTSVAIANPQIRLFK